MEGQFGVWCLMWWKVASLTTWFSYSNLSTSSFSLIVCGLGRFDNVGIEGGFDDYYDMCYQEFVQVVVLGSKVLYVIQQQILLLELLEYMNAYVVLCWYIILNK